jgi:hypothetical protein
MAHDISTFYVLAKLYHGKPILLCLCKKSSCTKKAFGATEKLFTPIFIFFYM